MHSLYETLKVAFPHCTCCSKLPDPDLPFKLIADSCGFGLGAVLMQEGRPAAFYSTKPTAPECNFVYHEQALLAALVALKQLTTNLQGYHCTVVTDDKPNTYSGNASYTVTPASTLV